jgi:TetR/AcrR family transcriptional regulator, cholesterol catabolism regulator
MARGRATDTPSSGRGGGRGLRAQGLPQRDDRRRRRGGGVSRATLYTYVDGKQHLLDMIVAAVQDDMAAGLDEALYGGAPGERLRRFVDAHAKAFLENRAFYGIVFAEEKDLSDRGRRAFRAWARLQTDDFTWLVQQDLAPDVDAAFVADAVLSMLSTLHRWYEPGGAVGERELADHLFLLVHGALAGAAHLAGGGRSGAPWSRRPAICGGSGASGCP